MDNQYDNLLEALADLKNRGYGVAFNFTPDGLYCPLTKQYFTSDQVRVVEHHYFEGNSDVSDMSILYVIETTGDCKGVLIDAYGTYSDINIEEFLNLVKT